MADRDAERIRREAQVRRSENAVQRGATASLDVLRAVAARELKAGNYDPAVLDPRHPDWSAALEAHLLPEVTAAYLAGLAQEAARGTFDGNPYADRHLDTVRNRLVGVADTVFDQIRTELRTGRLQGESIPELAKRVDAFLADDQQWAGRARTIARTECLPGDTPVSGARLTAVYRRSYDGEWITVRTARGGEFSGTPNHPMLTSRGWVSMGALTESDDLICDRSGIERSRPPSNQDVGERPPTLCEIYEAVEAVAVTERERTGQPDFHGDGTTDSHVNVLRPDGVLLADHFAPVTECRCKAVLSPADARTVASAAYCSPFPRFDGDSVVCLSTGTPLDSGLIEDADDNSLGYIELVRKALARPSLLVSRDDLRYGQVTEQARFVASGAPSQGRFGSGPDMDSRLTDPPQYRVRVDAELMADRHRPEPALIETDRVVSVERSEWSGHVYNLTTVDGYFTIGGYYTGNTIAANNAGAHAAAGHVAGMLGHDHAQVVQQWLATPDGRTRPTHTDADGQEVLGLDATFTVGGYDLAYPGDPNGPPEECCNCRCTAIYVYPGDPGYPDTLTAGGTVTATAPEAPPADAPVDAPTPPAPDANGEVRWPWTGVACPDGIKTGDGRKLVNVTWADLPMPLRAQFTEDMGHDGAVIVGLIEDINLDGNLVRFSGTWDDETKNPQAAEARRHNINGQMRGVSIDADEGTISFEDGDGNPIDSEALWDLGPEDEVVMVVDGPRIRAATQCMIPAYVEAYVVDNTVPDDQRPTESETVTAAAGVTGVGLTAAALLAREETVEAAPASVFADPELDGPTPLTVTDDGRVFGHLATWGTCHIGIEGACVTPPTSEASYAYFLTGEYHTSDGQMVPVGAVTIDTGHAGIDLSAGPTVAHYDNTGSAAAYVNAGEDEHGIWVAGVLAEGLTLPKRQALQRSGSLSGDWRRIGGNLELVAALAVNVPGFPIPKVQSRVASAHQTSLVASGVVKDHDTDSADFSRAVGKAVERHLRTRTARARVRRLRAETTMQRINRLRGQV